MTLTRGLTVAVLALLATVVLVGLCGPFGTLAWLAVVVAAIGYPDHALKIITNFQPKSVWRWTASTWAWLDRR